MTFLLAGDIGGTKTILRLVESHQIADEPRPRLKLATLYEQQYVSAAYADLVPMVQDFIQAAATQAGVQDAPKRACFAIAGPVVNNQSTLTNLSWSLSADRLREELSLENVELINDFEAVGYGVLGLETLDLHTLQAGDYEPDAPIAVIGAGTGLGQGFLIPYGADHVVFPTEGGHADFAPRSELEFHLLQYLLDKHQITRVSVERVVSGQGIVSIYQFLRDRGFAEETPDIAEAVATWERQAGLKAKTVDPGAVISRAALEGRDRICEKTMDMFIDAYGAEAGNLALKLLPFGGLYVAGGIAAKNLSLMESGRFMQAFTHKGRMSDLLERVPVHVVRNPQVGLIGAALRAAKL